MQNSGRVAVYESVSAANSRPAARSLRRLLADFFALFELFCAEREAALELLRADTEGVGVAAAGGEPCSATEEEVSAGPPTAETKPPEARGVEEPID